LIEDDRELGAQLLGRLRKAGYDPTWWQRGDQVTRETFPQVDLVVLDLMLPGVYGLDLLKQLRTFSDVPVLVLSARIDTGDKVRALQLGADDYMTKPFWPEELLERVRARLRRPTMGKTEHLDAGPIHVDLGARTATIDGEPLELTRVELDLLAALARRPGDAVTRAWLVEHVLDPARDGTERTLDVHVSRLRKKLGRASLIETVWGIGYRLAVRDR